MKSMIDPLLIATISVIGEAVLNTVRGFLGSSESTYDITPPVTLRYQQTYFNI